MKRILRTLVIGCLLVTVLVPYLWNDSVTEANANTKTVDDYTFTLNSLTATDAVGRTLPRVSGAEDGKYVGLFYFLWHGQHAADKPRNVTELLKTNYDDLFDASPNNTVVPYGSWLHYQEPLYGYYNSMDEWVMRKHIEMFIAADVDFLVMDFTNGVGYWQPLKKFMDLLLEYKAAGWDVPELTFYINVDAQNLTKQVYNIVYNKKKYKELAFYGNSDKPIIISVPHLLSDDMKNFFDVRASQWYRDQYPTTTFPYWTFSRDWKVYTDMVNISVAQTGTAFSYVFESWDGKDHPAWGRGYSSSNPKNGDVNAILRGDNFQEGWDAAIRLDPDIVFITGWNEWVVQKRNLGEHMPNLCPYDFPDYTDNFNVEYSRDLEMTKVATYVKGKDGTYVQEGYGDNYYLQLVYNIRKYKGILSGNTKTNTKGMTIDLDGSLSQWEQVSTRYVALSSDKVARDADGFYKNTHYTQAAPDNFIQDVKVTFDNTYIYFNVRTENNVTAHKQGKTNWMNLFIGVNGSNQGKWESFNYVVNRNPKSSTVTSLEAFTGTNTYGTKAVCDIQYRVQGKSILFQIPRSAVGLTGNAFGFTFKVADGIQEESNILDYYVSGESFPLGRMAYIYETESGVVPGGSTAAPSVPVPSETQQPGTTQNPDGTPSADVSNEEDNKDNSLWIALIIIAAAVFVAVEVFVIIIFVHKKKKEHVK